MPGSFTTFYEGELKADDSVQRREPLRKDMDNFWPQRNDCPIVFCNIVGKEEDYKAHKRVHSGRVDSHSKCNHQEAMKVVS